MASLEPRQSAPLDARARRANNGAKEPRVRALVGWHLHGLRLWLGIVHMAPDFLEGGNRGQHELWPKASRQPTEPARPPAWTWRRYRLTSGLEALLPKPGVPFFDHGETPVHLCQLRLRLEIRQCSVERRAVNLI